MEEYELHIPQPPASSPLTHETKEQDFIDGDVEIEMKLTPAPSGHDGL